MAISVDTTYKTVLSILNKESRGFLTPDEFNKVAAQVQLDILEKNFYDYNRAVVKSNLNRYVSEYGDIPSNIKEKIDVLAKEASLNISNGVAPAPSDLYKIININTANRTINLEEISKSELSYVNSSKLTAPTASFPVYYKEANNVKIFPSSISSAIIDYIKTPTEPVWGGVTDSYGAITYAAGSSTDFDLHISDRVQLIIGILKYAGVVISDPQIIQAASAEANSQVQLENL
tara:strand:- start:622 stop:1320 length:699 start_codon:yes stop_codon:yes gene_type:complete